MRIARSALLALLLGVLLAELVVRLFPPDRFGSLRLVPYDMVEPIVAGLKVDPETSYLVFDAELGWQVGSNRLGHDGLYNSDASGRRRSGSLGDDLAVPWAAAFGDSFTHGDDVGDSETWLAQLGVRGLSVSNYAVPGYGVDQAWLRYRRLKERIGAPVVLIALMADNIARHVNRYRPFITPSERIFFLKPRFHSERGQLTLFPPPFRDWSEYARSSPELTADLIKVGRDDRFFDPRYYATSPFDRVKLFRIARTLALTPAKHADWRPLYDDSNALDLTVEIVAGFAEEVRADRREPVIVFLPERTVAQDVIAGRRPPTSALVDRLKKLPYRVIDLTTPVADFVRAGGADEPFRPHYSPELSRAIAGFIIHWKSGEKSLP